MHRVTITTTHAIGASGCFLKLKNTKITAPDSQARGQETSAIVSFGAASIAPASQMASD